MGLWDYNWTHELLTFAILTTEPGPRFRRFHNRVPAIAPTADAVDPFLVGAVYRALDLASRSHDVLISVALSGPAEGGRPAGCRHCPSSVLWGEPSGNVR